MPINVSHLCAWGCVCYIRTLNAGQKKLDAQATKCVFVGVYDNKAYHLWSPAKHKMLKSRDFVFDEGAARRTMGYKVLVDGVDVQGVKTGEAVDDNEVDCVSDATIDVDEDADEREGSVDVDTDV